MNSTPKIADRLPVSILGAAVFFFALWLFEFPMPCIDDLFYCGAGLHMASGGDFSNPLLARQDFSSHWFYVYPPLHSYALWGWLRLFGISTWTMTAFQLFNYSIAAIATIFILRRHGAPRWLEWLVPLGVTGTLWRWGLRPEPFAIALTMAGLALIGPGAASPIRMFFGFLAMCLGASAAPRVGPFACVLMAVGLAQSWRDLAATRRLLTTLILICIAGATTAMVFLCMIHFRIAEFLHTFHDHMARVGGSKAALLGRFLSTFVGPVELPLLLLVGALLALNLRHPNQRSTWMGLAIAGAFVVTALMGALGPGSVWFAVFCLFVLMVPTLSGASALRRRMVAGIVVLALLAANSRPLIGVVGQITGAIDRDTGPTIAEARAIQSTPDHPVLIDVATARYVFDYRLPAGVLDWSFAAPFPGELAIESPLRASDIFVLGPTSVDTLAARHMIDLSTPKWTPAGLRRWSYQRYPRRPYIIRAEDCRPASNP